MAQDIDVLPVRRALISVYDKTGVVDFARRLADAGVAIVSSGGTAATLSEAGIPVTLVAETTGAPEMLGGRVKTLHPRIHAGILANLAESSHQADLDAAEIEPFQLVVVSLYPFEATVANPDVTHAEAIEKIDIGGPTMIRAAAKNHAFVGAVTGVDQYEMVLEGIEAGGLTADLRATLARAAFARTAAYDAAIANWLHGEPLPQAANVSLEHVDTLRYGENPHQEAALYRTAGASSWWSDMHQHQGKAMSFNNYIDTEAAWRLANDLASPAVVIVKHTNTSGAAIASSVSEAFSKAWECDSLSSFGGVVAVNATVDAETAEKMIEYFLEVVIAPGFADEALPVFAGKKNLRILQAPPPSADDREIRMIDGGALVQARDHTTIGASGSGLPGAWSVVAGPDLDEATLDELRFAWVVAAHTKSNAIVVTKDRSAIGVGAGDQSRVGASERALAKAGERSQGSVAASDAFFPFRDGIDALAAAGVKAVIEPGGSMRDDEVIAAAGEHGVTLVFTGERHFKH